MPLMRGLGFLAWPRFEAFEEQPMSVHNFRLIILVSLSELH